MTFKDLKDLKCPRCGGEMEAGLVVDRGHYSVPEVAKWVEGSPERSRSKEPCRRDTAKHGPTTHHIAVRLKAA